jgi:hypothetical protein
MLLFFVSKASLIHLKKCSAKLEFFAETYYTVKVFSLAPHLVLMLHLCGAHPSRCAPSQLVVVEASEASWRWCDSVSTSCSVAHRWPRAQAQVEILTRRLVLCQVWISHWLRTRKYEKVFSSKIADSTPRIFLQCSTLGAEFIAP